MQTPAPARRPDIPQPRVQPQEEIEPEGLAAAGQRNVHAVPLEEDHGAALTVPPGRKDVLVANLADPVPLAQFDRPARAARLRAEAVALEARLQSVLPGPLDGHQVVLSHVEQQPRLLQARQPTFSLTLPAKNSRFLTHSAAWLHSQFAAMLRGPVRRAHACYHQLGGVVVVVETGQAGNGISFRGW